MEHAGPMRLGLLLMVLAGALVALVVPPLMAGAAAPPGPGPAMAQAAVDLLAALSADQRKKATFPLEDAHRVTFFYVPIARKGVSLKEMTPPQRERVHALLRAGLGPTGYSKTTQIIELEKVLAELEKNPVRRDHELYYVSIFGPPAATGTWGWRFEGHHVSQNFTIVKGTMFATSPQFLGVNPAEVRVEGPLKGRRVLHLAEDLGHELIGSLDEQQRARAVFAAEAPAEILTTNLPRVDPQSPAGLPAKALNPRQAATLRKLLAEYAAHVAEPLARQRLARAEKAGFDQVHFAWAGGLGRGQKYYYRIQSPTFLIEADNTQGNGNHLHTVWRDFEGDFGRDLLREHHQAAHRAR